MKKIINIMALLLWWGCSTSPHDIDVSLQEGYQFKVKSTQLAIKKMNQLLLADKSSWPKVYASFGNVDYFFGEELTIKALTFSMLKFDGQYSYVTQVNSELEPSENDIFFVGSSFEQQKIPYNLFDVNRTQQLEMHMQVEGENKNKTIITARFSYDFMCGEKKCEFKSYQEAIKATENFDSLKITLEVAKKNKYDADVFSFVDPINKYREEPRIVAKLYRRMLWAHMPSSIYQLYGFSDETGSFTCQVKHVCQSGFYNIVVVDDKVVSFKFDFNKRKVQ